CGLMEFQDMARVHDVDPKLVARTRDWLLQQRQSDGSWPEEGHGLHDDPTRVWLNDTARLATTAYIAWAVFDGKDELYEQRATLEYLLSHGPASIRDPHVLALICNALLGMEPDGRHARDYLARLESLAHASAGGKFVWWEQPAGAQTTFYGSGRAGSIETTALAALAKIKAAYEPRTRPRALAWLAAQKDATGTWQSTQATVLALKALLAGTAKSLGGERERRIQVSWGSGSKSLVIPADQAEVVQQLDLTEHLGRGDF